MKEKKRGPGEKLYFVLLVYIVSCILIVLPLLLLWSGNIGIWYLDQILKLNLKTVYTVHRGKEKVRTREREEFSRQLDRERYKVKK